MESGWEDGSGDELSGIYGKRSGVCKIVIGLLCFRGRGGNLSRLRLPGSGCSMLVGRCGRRKKQFCLIRRKGFSLDKSPKKIREDATSYCGCDEEPGPTFWVLLSTK